MSDLRKVIAGLKGHYGEPKLPGAKGPFELVLWENACYLLSDERRAAVFEALRAQVGLNAAAIWRPSSICWRHTCGPSTERAGCSHRPSSRKCSRSSRNVKLMAVPPRSTPAMIFILVIRERLDAGSGVEVIHHFHFPQVDDGDAAVAVIRHERGLTIG